MKCTGLLFQRPQPVVLHKSLILTKFLVSCEHQRLLPAQPTLVTASLYKHLYIIKGRRIQWSITCIIACVKCRRVASRPKLQILRQLLADHLLPGPVFDWIGVKYTGPCLVKLDLVCKSVVRKAYIAVFTCFATKAVHLEVISALTTAAFLATLLRYIARWGNPPSFGATMVLTSWELPERLKSCITTCEHGTDKELF